MVNCLKDAPMLLYLREGEADANVIP